MWLDQYKFHTDQAISKDQVKVEILSKCDRIVSMTTASLYASGSNHKVTILSYKQHNKGLTYALK